MDIVPSMVALGKGLGLCLKNQEIRSLAIRPWLTGAVCYFASVITAYYSHPIILSWLLDPPEGFWSTLLYYLAYLGVAVGLLIATLVLSIGFVLVFSSVYQTAIVARVLVHLGNEVPTDTPGLRGVIKEAGRTIAVESLKLLWLVPLFILLIVLGFIPFLTPFTFIAGAWLLAYQFVDIVLDVYKISAGKRLKFSMRHGILLVPFGATLAFFWAVPFVGLLLPPAAAAGAAWLLSETKLLPTVAKENLNPSS